MAGTPLEKLNLSVRANNVLHRMGITSVEELTETSMEDIARQRNIGVKTLAEIKSAIENTVSIIECASIEDDKSKEFTAEQLHEMSCHSIDELNLSARPYNALHQASYLTIDKVALLTDSDLAQMKKLGRKSTDEIITSVDSWIQKNMVFATDSLHTPIDPVLKDIIQEVAAAITPIIHIYWRQLLDYIIAEGIAERIKCENRNWAIMAVLQLPQIKDKILTFWSTAFPQGIILPGALVTFFNSFELTFEYSLLVDAALASKILIMHRDVFLIPRDTFLDLFERNYDLNDRTTQILQFRVEGESLQDIGDLFELTRERVRQITTKFIRTFPIVFEDYFSAPYQYFHLRKSEFIQAFSEVSEEGYEYLSIRYIHGKVLLTSESINTYDGPWKERLVEFLRKKEENIDRNTVSKTEMVMRVLISNADRPLSIEEFESEYYHYIHRKGYPENRLKINMRSVGNHLRKAKGVVFNCDNKVRYCSANLHSIWENIDFTQYKNMIISAELLFRDYHDLMDELDIRDGYELFYLIKSSLSMWNPSEFTIHCRRVPVLILGEASEKEQAIKLLREISPVPYFDYYAAYEERYGVHRESAQGNSTISSAVGTYYTDGQYIIDAPTIDERDVQPLINSLRDKPIWFIEDIENLFDSVCTYTTHDAINAAAFRRIGYTLHTAYAYNASYGTALNFFDEVIFTKEVVDISTLDRRITNLQMFAAALDKKKKSLEYIETAPKILMSLKKVEEIYQLTLAEIEEIQSILSTNYHAPFFNGRSVWNEVSNLPIIQKLQGNDWLLTCIMRQQERVFSLSVAGGIILSLDNSLLSLSQICEWLSSLYGPMSINALEKRFNSTFGTKVSASKLAEKLKTSGAWNDVVTDSMDEYIDSLVDSDLSGIDADNLFQEEFF